MDWGVAAAIDLAVVRPGLGHVSGITAPCGTPRLHGARARRGRGRPHSPLDRRLPAGRDPARSPTRAAPQGQGVSPASSSRPCAASTRPSRPGRRPSSRPSAGRPWPPSTRTASRSVAELKDALADALRRTARARAWPRTPPGPWPTRSAPGSYARWAEAVAGFRQAPRPVGGERRRADGRARGPRGLRARGPGPGRPRAGPGPGRAARAPRPGARPGAARRGRAPARRSGTGRSGPRCARGARSASRWPRSCWGSRPGSS